MAQVKVVCQNCNTPGTFTVGITNGIAYWRCKRCHKSFPIKLKDGNVVMEVKKPKDERATEDKKPKEGKVKEKKKSKEGKVTEENKPKDGKVTEEGK